MKKILFVLLCLGCCNLPAQAARYEIRENIPYYDQSVREADDYISTRCKLDVYYPTEKKGFPSVVWFHGGGLRAGDKHIPDGLKDKGVAVIAVNYRLNPQVKAPVYIEDAAAAVAWVFKNIASYGGDPAKIFLSGHSAGGYLTSMVGLDKRWLYVHGVDADSIAGLIPLSGHTITHFTVRDERGIPGTRPVIDELAPLFHVRADAPPLLLITGDREKEMLGRYEENAYLMRMMKVVGHPDTRIFELDGYGHNIADPACPLVIDEVNRLCKDIGE